MSAPLAQLMRLTGREPRQDAQAAAFRSLRNLRDTVLAPHGQS